MAFRSSFGYGLLLGKHCPRLGGKTNILASHDSFGSLLWHIPERNDTAGLFGHIGFLPSLSALRLFGRHSAFLSGSENDLGRLPKKTKRKRQYAKASEYHNTFRSYQHRCLSCRHFFCLSAGSDNNCCPAGLRHHWFMLYPIQYCRPVVRYQSQSAFIHQKRIIRRYYPHLYWIKNIIRTPI